MSWESGVPLVRPAGTVRRVTRSILASSLGGSPAMRIGGFGGGGGTLDLVQPTRRVNRPLFLLHPHFQKGQGVISA